MHLNLIALVLPALVLGRAAVASPIEGIANAKAVSITDYSGLEAATKGTQTTCRGRSIHGMSATTPNTGFHALSTLVNQGLIVCSDGYCSGSCTFYGFDGNIFNTCYTTQDEFASAYIYSSGGAALPYGVYVAPDQCDYTVQLPVVNQCYNLFYAGEPADFSSYGLSTG